MCIVNLCNMIWFILVLLTIVLPDSSFAKSYSVDISEFEQCEEVENKLKFDVEDTGSDPGNVEKFNGNITIPFDIDDNVKFSLNFAKYEGGTYQDNFYDTTLRGCKQFMEYTNDFLIKALETSGKQFECPIMRNEYVIKNFDIKLEPNTKVLPIGYFKLSIDITDLDDQKSGCITMKTVISEK